MSDIPTTEPLSIRAGDKIQWQISSEDYPASESYELKYYLTKAGAPLIEITAAASGDDYLVTIEAETSDDFEPGVYTYQGRIEKDDAVETIREGIIQVYRDISQDSTGATLTGAIALGDPRLELQFYMGIKASILDLMAGKVLADNQTYSIAGRSLSKYTFTELMAFKNDIEREIVKLKRTLGLTRGQKIQVQF